MYFILMACITQYSTKTRLIVWPEVQGKRLPEMSNPQHIPTYPRGVVDGASQVDKD